MAQNEGNIVESNSTIIECELDPVLELPCMITDQTYLIVGLPIIMRHRQYMIPDLLETERTKKRGVEGLNQILIYCIWHVAFM